MHACMYKIIYIFTVLSDLQFREWHHYVLWEQCQCQKYFLLSQQTILKVLLRTSTQSLSVISTNSSLEKGCCCINIKWNFLILLCYFRTSSQNHVFEFLSLPYRNMKLPISFRLENWEHYNTIWDLNLFIFIGRQGLGDGFVSLSCFVCFSSLLFPGTQKD